MEWKIDKQYYKITEYKKNNNLKFHPTTCNFKINHTIKLNYPYKGNITKLNKYKYGAHCASYDIFMIYQKMKEENIKIEYI